MEELCHWWKDGDMNKLIEAFIDSLGVKSTELKDFCSRFLRLSVFPWCRERPQIVMLWVEWFGRLKCRSTGRLFLHSVHRICNG